MISADDSKGIFSSYATVVGIDGDQLELLVDFGDVSYSNLDGRCSSNRGVTIHKNACLNLSDIQPPVNQNGSRVSPKSYKSHVPRPPPQNRWKRDSSANAAPQENTAHLNHPPVRATTLFAQADLNQPPVRATTLFAQADLSQPPMRPTTIFAQAERTTVDVPEATNMLKKMLHLEQKPVVNRASGSKSPPSSNQKATATLMAMLNVRKPDTRQE